MEALEPETSQDVIPTARLRWMEAEKAARAAEDELHFLWVDFFSMGKPAPSAEQQRRAAFLRSAAVLALSEARAEQLSRERTHGIASVRLKA